jgi:hypothetical protein
MVLKALKDFQGTGEAREYASAVEHRVTDGQAFIAANTGPSRSGPSHSAPGLG